MSNTNVIKNNQDFNWKKHKVMYNLKIFLLHKLNHYNNAKYFKRGEKNVLQIYSKFLRNCDCLQVGIQKKILH